MANLLAYVNAATQGPPIYMKAPLGDGKTISTAFVPGIAIVDASGNQITSFGGGTQYTSGTTQATPTGTVALGSTSGNVVYPLQLDTNKYLLADVTGNVASLASDSGNPVKIGAVYNTTAPAPTNGQRVDLQADAAGNLKVNTGIYTGAPTQGAVSVLVTNTSLLSANAQRSYLLIQNQDPTNPIWVSFGGTATANNSCVKIIAGASLIFESGYIPNTSVSAISTGGTVLVQVIEGN